MSANSTGAAGSSWLSSADSLIKSLINFMMAKEKRRSLMQRKRLMGPRINRRKSEKRLSDLIFKVINYY